MKKKGFFNVATAGAALILLVSLIPIASAVFLPVYTANGIPVARIEAGEQFDGMHCVFVSGQPFRDALFGLNGRDPYWLDVMAGTQKPYRVFCGFDKELVGIGVAGGTCLNG